MFDQTFATCQSKLNLTNPVASLSQCSQCAWTILCEGVCLKPSTFDRRLSKDLGKHGQWTSRKSGKKWINRPINQSDATVCKMHDVTCRTYWTKSPSSKERPLLEGKFQDQSCVVTSKTLVFSSYRKVHLGLCLLTLSGLNKKKKRWKSDLAAPRRDIKCVLKTTLL